MGTDASALRRHLAAALNQVTVLQGVEGDCFSDTAVV